MVVSENVGEKTFTLGEFEALIALPENADRRLELIAGEIHEKMPTELHGLLIFILAGEIYIFLRANPIARAGVDVRHRAPGDEHNDLRPDLSVTMQVEAPIVGRGVVPRMPDLAVEVKSPDDTYAAMRRKADYYLAHGARLVWLFYPEKRLVEVYKKDADSALLDATDTLDGGDVLPGFRLPLAELWGKLPIVIE
jgi:Uma2 family endonuclease